MASTTVHVEGLQQLGERMRALSRDMNLKIAGQATGAAAQVIKKRAKRNILTSPSVDTRSLYDAVISKKIPRSQTQLTSEHIVTVRGRGKKGKKLKGKQRIAPHGHLVEFGTVNMPAEPFLRPAFDQEKGFAVGAMIAKLKAGITKAGA
jgi:HK97 gp10 family phage protein